ncbi:TolC family protein [Segetibacter koreensis]|uniref:TolC family protein n=1 Tax=Segetibacter koreensis TaxID=398037 RepID=UPI0003811B1A|nr:TolC family protein [Segetibacter koreensis]
MFKLTTCKPAVLRGFMAIGCAFFLFGSISAQVTAQDTLSYTLAQAEQQFLQKNLTLLAGHYNVNANRALIDQAKVWDNPVLITDQNIYADGKSFFSHGKDLSGESRGQIFIQVQQLIRTAGKRARQIDLAVTTSEMSELQLQDVLRNLKYQLRSDYYTISQLFSVQQIYNQELEEMKHLVTGMEAQLKAGNIAQREYLRVQALVISLQQDITENNRNLSNSEAELKTLLQVTGNTFIKPADSLAFPTFTTPSLDTLVAAAKSNNAAYLLQQKLVLYQQQNLQYQKALKSPDITVGPEYDKASNYAPNYVGLTLSLPLPVFNKNKGNIKAAEFSIQQQQVSAQQLETELSNNIINAYSKLTFTQQQNNSTQNDFYNSYQKMFTNMMLSYRQRQLSLLEFIDFFDTYKEANIRLRQQQLNLQLAKEELNFQAGTDILK